MTKADLFFFILLILSCVAGLVGFNKRDSSIKDLQKKLERCENYRCPPGLTNAEIKQSVLEERINWLQYIAEKFPGVKPDSNLISDLRRQIERN